MRLPLLRHPNRESGTAPDSTCSWRTSNMNQTDSCGTRKNLPFRMFKIEHPRRRERFARSGIMELCPIARTQTSYLASASPLRWGRFSTRVSADLVELGLKGNRAKVIHLIATIARPYPDGRLSCVLYCFRLPVAVGCIALALGLI